MLGLSASAARAALAFQTALVDGGVLRIYGGLRGAQNALLLAELTLQSPAFGVPIADARFPGYLAAAANAVGREDAALARGDPTWYMATNMNGEPVFYGQVNGERADLVLDRQTIEKFGPVFVTEWLLLQPVERI